MYQNSLIFKLFEEGHGKEWPASKVTEALKVREALKVKRQKRRRHCWHRRRRRNWRHRRRRKCQRRQRWRRKSLPSKSLSGIRKYWPHPPWDLLQMCSEMSRSPVWMWGRWTLQRLGKGPGRKRLKTASKIQNSNCMPKLRRFFPVFHLRSSWGIFEVLTVKDQAIVEELKGKPDSKDPSKSVGR